MTASIPGFVLSQGASAVDWVERDDRLSLENQVSSYYERNQRDWWVQNRKIRELFGDMERQIRRLLGAGEVPSVMLLSWSKLARMLSCDRATLQHPRRKHWVNARRVELLTLIERARQQALLPSEPLMPEISELEQLRKSLSAQREQTGIMYGRCIGLEQEINQLKRLLALRDSRIKELLANSYDRNQQLLN